MNAMEKLVWLANNGYQVGPRDPRLNTKFEGSFMIVEAGYQDDVLPNHILHTEDGRNGPWCIVGNDLSSLIDEAYRSLS